MISLAKCNVRSLRGASDEGIVDFAGIVLSSIALHALDHTAKTESLQR